MNSALTYHAIRTWCVVHPNPVGTIICHPVLAMVSIITTTSRHGVFLMGSGGWTILKNGCCYYPLVAERCGYEKKVADLKEKQELND